MLARASFYSWAVIKINQRKLHEFPVDCCCLYHASNSLEKMLLTVTISAWKYVSTFIACAVCNRSAKSATEIVSTRYFLLDDLCKDNCRSAPNMIAMNRQQAQLFLQSTRADLNFLEWWLLRVHLSWKIAKPGWLFRVSIKHYLRSLEASQCSIIDTKRSKIFPVAFLRI